MRDLDIVITYEYAQGDDFKDMITLYPEDAEKSFGELRVDGDDIIGKQILVFEAVENERAVRVEADVQRSDRPDSILPIETKAEVRRDRLFITLKGGKNEKE